MCNDLRVRFVKSWLSLRKRINSHFIYMFLNTMLYFNLEFGSLFTHCTMEINGTDMNVVIFLT